MEVHCGSDHRGYELKRQIVEYLSGLGHVCFDHGAHGPERVDYPAYAQLVGEAVVRQRAAGEEAFGIVVCGSGVGISIAANKVRGVSCVVAWCEHAAEYGRRHNHGNVLAFGADMQTFTQVRRCLDAYLGASEEGERHAERVVMVREMENA
jgi:ribose 5-phosphate isomerase B